MSLLSRLGGMFRGAALPQPRPTSAISQALMWLQGAPLDAYPFKTKQDKLSANIGWAYAAVNRIGLDVRAAPRKLWRQTGGKGPDDWEEVPEEDQPSILLQPTAAQLMDEFVQTTVMHLDLTGEAYWHLITAKEAGGKVLGVQLIYPHWVDEPVLNEFGVITGWRVVIPGRSYYVVPAEDMVFLKYPHMLDPLRGMSPVEAFAITHDMDIYTRAYASSLMKNRATPELVISLEGSVTQEQAKVVSENWMDTYRDPANGPAVIGAGSKVQQLGLSIADLKFLELTQASRETILAVYGVPAAIIGLTTDFNRANSETAEAIYVRNVLHPRLEMIEKAWNSAVMPRAMMRGRTSRDTERLWWGFDKPIPEDRDFSLRQSGEMFTKGAITLNEYREKQGFDSLKKDGDVWYMPMSVSVISSVASVTDEEPEPILPPADPNAPQLPPPSDPKSDKPDPKEDAKAKEEAKNERFMGEAIAVRSEKTLVLKMRAAKAEFLERQGRLERSLKSEVRRLFSKEQKALLDNLKANGLRTLQDLAETRHRASGVAPLTRDWIEDEIEKQQDEWEATFREFMLRGLREGWLLVAADVAQSIRWDLYRPQAEVYARTLAGLKIKDIRKTTLKGVRNVIGDGIVNGSSIDTISDDLRRLYDGFKGVRAETIARSETAQSIGIGKNQHADEIESRLNLKLMKTWISVDDDRTRDSHVNANGQTVPQNEPFTVGNASLFFPCDPNGPAEEVINCRCTPTYGQAEE